MSENPPFEYGNEHNFASSKAITGETVLYSTSDLFVVLSAIPWDEMRSLTFRYCDEHDEAIADIWILPQKLGTGSKEPYNGVNTPNTPPCLWLGGGGKNSAGRYAHAPAVITAFNETIGNGNGVKVREIRPLLMKQSRKSMRRIAEKMVRPNVRRMTWARGNDQPGHIQYETASQRVIDLLDASNSTDAFLDKLLRPVLGYLSSPLPTFKGMHRTTVPFARVWFAAWLTMRGFLLFPRNTTGRALDLFHFFRYRILIPKLLLPASAREEWLRVTTAIQEGTPSSFQTRVSRHSFQTIIFGTVLTQPELAHWRVSPEAFASARANSRTSNEDNALIASWNYLAVRLQAQGISGEALHQAEKIISPAATQGSDILWAWIDDPKYLTRSHKYLDPTLLPAAANLRAHTEDLRRIFPEIANKIAYGTSAYLGYWLSFLLTVDDEIVPTKLLGIKPSLIVHPDDNAQSFCSWAKNENLPTSGFKGTLGLLTKAWLAANRLEQDAHTRICPIPNYQFRNARTKVARTTRRAIDQDILNLLIEENRANDFSFSRERIGTPNTQPQDNRKVLDRETGKIASIWWPGTAVLMDLLLQIPLRHKQGRFIDSGEGDEFLLELDTLELHRNTLPTANPRRQEAFVRRVQISNLREDFGIGMYVNTNKTGVDYTFPFLEESIARNVQQVIDWQKKYNPIDAPISDRIDDDSAAAKAARIDPVWVYPVFRDPDYHNHKPVSNNILLSYFRSLLRRVEKKYNLKNNSTLRFFNDSDEPIFDIHSLRVTGVTRLLEAGVPPEIVRALVGHASIIMTYYYDVLSNSRVTRELNRALEARRPNREALIKMTPEERVEFLARLHDGHKDGEPQPKLIAIKLIEERSPFLDVRFDGICPGMSCRDAGVWRNQACGCCKYFVTGAPFYAGLVLKANGLMAEIIQGQKNIKMLNERVHSLRDEGRVARSVEAEICQQNELVDGLADEWIRTVHYIRLAEKELIAWLDLGEGKETSAIKLVTAEKSTLEARVEASHHLHLFTRLIEGAKQVQGFVPPAGVLEKRNEILLEIAFREHKADLFFQMPPRLRQAALDQFGLLLSDSVIDREDMEALIDGTSKLRDIPNISSWLDQISAARLSCTTELTSEDE